MVIISYGFTNEGGFGDTVFRIMVEWNSYSFCVQVPARLQGGTGYRETVTGS